MNPYAPSSLLAQVRPSNTTAVTAFTASLRTEITRILVANTSASAATLRLFHDDDGSTYDETTALVWDNSLAAGAYLDLQAYLDGAGITLLPSGTLGVRSGTGNALTFNVYGTVADAR